ncbi:tail fiber domain-containing protein [Microcoleus sp. Pol12B5]|uniref:tail fiber domain-containing protein n=1 Tax=Microcoleus sp. Pol12B5 TaxID=3055396 RepID=UPI002FD6B4A0
MTNSNSSNVNLVSIKGTDIFQIFLQDEDGQNILSIDDGALRQSLRIEIVNTSGRNIEYQEVGTPGTQEGYHFCILFRPGTLVDPEKITLKKEDGWEMSLSDKDNIFYLRKAEPNSEIKNGERVTLTLQNIGAAPQGGSRGTRVEIKYNYLQYKGSTEIISGYRLEYLNIVNQRGKKQVPIYAGFLGSNTIINDGTENELTLSIQLLPLLNSSLQAKSLVGKKSSVEDTSKLPEFDINSIQDVQIAPSSLERIILQNIIFSLGKNNELKTFFDSLSKLSLVIKNSDLTNNINIFLNDSNEDENKYKALKLIIAELNKSNNPLVINLTNSILEKFFFQFVVGEKFKTVSQEILVYFIYLSKDLGFSFSSENLSKLKELTIIHHKKEGDTDKRSLTSPPVALKDLDEGIKFTISFDVAMNEQSNNNQWALVSQNDVDTIGIDIIKDGTIDRQNWIESGQQKQGMTPQWSFTYIQGLNLENRQEILKLSITKLKTQLLSGYANLYVHYENIPGYWDGYITVPIHKGPLVYREYEGTNKVKVGCVGIGTDEPQAKLHVKTNDQLGIALKVDGNSNLTGKVGIGIEPGNEQLTVKGDTAIVGNLSVTNDISVGEKIEVMATGDELGKKLYFRGATENTDSIWMSRFNSGADRSSLRICLGDDGENALEIGYTDHTNNGQWKKRFSIAAKGDTNITGNLSVTNGRIGIGSSDFSKEPLVIRAVGSQEGLIAFEGPDTDKVKKWVKKWHIEQNYGGNTPGLNLVETGVSDFRLFIQKGSGNIGIGAGTPNNGKLEIKQTEANKGIVLHHHTQNIKCRIGLEDNGNFFIFRDDPNSNSRGIYMNNTNLYLHDITLIASSDISLKKEVSNLNNILNQVIQLNPVRFIWKDSEICNIGFIAQEVEQIFPELVTSINNEKGELKGLAYTDFGVLAIAAIKEVAQTIEELSLKCDKLAQKSNDLAIENRELQRRLEILKN